MHVVFEGADTEDYESGPMEYVGYQEGRFDQDIIEFFDRVPVYTVVDINE